MTDPIRRLAALLAGRGCVVGAPEVYHEHKHEPPGTVLRYAAAGTEPGNALKFGKPVAGFDADAATDLGGHLTLRAGLDPKVEAAARFYPTDLQSGTLGLSEADDTFVRSDGLKAETLFVSGGQDPHVPFAGLEAIRARLEEVGARCEWHEVNAAYAFLRDEGPRHDLELFLQTLGWMLALFGRTLHVT